MAFLKTILIIVLIYYLFKLVVKMFAPKIFGYAARKTQEHFNEKFGGFAQQEQARQERVGDVIIEKKPSKGSRSNNQVGDYIDFEEVE
ncbi:protein of unknown function [Zobellia uliginosa]|uniref:DUF4834 domain-containing protein n=1 Tax=Zobellia uliginosa TaxID=143224 RepID=A0ABY1KPA0_9FLAO|nr:DUF4834 family protein [Zobellia uliginosa]SIS56657.1 protein of unknown function [Zobellia uliginosa]